MAALLSFGFASPDEEPWPTKPTTCCKENDQKVHDVWLPNKQQLPSVNFYKSLTNQCSPFTVYTVPHISNTTN